MYNIEFPLKYYQKYGLIFLLLFVLLTSFLLKLYKFNFYMILIIASIISFYFKNNKEFSLSIFILNLMANLIFLSIIIPIIFSFLKDNNNYDNFQLIILIHEYYLQYVFTGLQEKSKIYIAQNIQYLSMLFIFFQAILGIYLNIKLMLIFKQKNVANYLINSIANHENKYRLFIIYILLSVGILMLLFNVDLEGCYKCSQEQKIDSSFLNLNNSFEIHVFSIWYFLVIFFDTSYLCNQFFINKF